MRRRRRRNPLNPEATSAANTRFSEKTYYNYTYSNHNGLKIALITGAVILTVAVIFIIVSINNDDDRQASADSGNVNIATMPPETHDAVSSDVTLSGGTTENDITGSDGTTDGNNSGTTLVMTSFSTIFYKSESERVQILQERLMELGYLHIDETTVYYGPATQRAVIAFQRQHSLKKTGNANKKTLTLMFSRDAYEYTLKEGDKGDDVREIQDILCELAYMDEHTGYYGSATADAVREFQTNNSLDATGVADRETIDKLYDPNAVPGSNYSKKEKRRATILEFMDYAEKQLGDRYSTGATGPDSFDCSGLVYYCLRQAGSSRRRLSAAGYSQVGEWEKITSRSDWEKGDLLFFYSSSSRSRIGHVGIYVGGGKMIDASTSEGRIVRRYCTTDYWMRLYAFARRPW